MNPFTRFKNSSQSNSEMKISQPTNFKHEIQVIYDKENKEYIGLPEEWRQLLDDNNIQ